MASFPQEDNSLNDGRSPGAFKALGVAGMLAALAIGVISMAGFAGGGRMSSAHAQDTESGVSEALAGSDAGNVISAPAQSASAPAFDGEFQGVEVTGIVTTGMGTCFPDAVLTDCDGTVVEQLKGPGGAGFFAPWYGKPVRITGARLTCGGADTYINVVSIADEAGLCPGGPLTATPPATAVPTATASPAPPTATPPGGGASGAGNVALGRPVVASTTQAGFPAERAVDGDLATFWASYPGSDPYYRAQNIQWIYVDLGVEQTVGDMRVRWGINRHARSYGVYTWDDGLRGWRQLGSTTGGDGDDTWTVRTGAKIEGRYFMLWLVNPHWLGGHYELAEWSIEGSGAGPATGTNEAVGKPATALTEDPAYPAGNATDGDLGTEWRPTALPAWLYVDLGTDIPIERVVLRWGTGLHATAYTVYVWSGGAWKAVHGERAGAGGDETIRVAETSRYVLLYAESSAGATVGLRELEVYRAGSGAPAATATPTPPIPPPPPPPIPFGSVDGAAFGPDESGREASRPADRTATKSPLLLLEGVEDPNGSRQGTAPWADQRRFEFRGLHGLRAPVPPGARVEDGSRTHGRGESGGGSDESGPLGRSGRLSLPHPAPARD